ncbi:carbohydrate kinase [Neurospora crassa]|uniref:Gluconokinase n=1 Tax=Neurospora crassa (strain ATCC 24698 / 74-OR23-1A / CBS 708.71 / DSM 1257 / FGSC 987) TaxID=367110 RepID=Q7SAZ9_NEUCR|nr:thermoresistant gluconokinase [Neurospora crassa OR74A]EAA33565.2 thermoresistant gluconokinase [Neurospora crassa OR74A]KHE84224.1 carbohydrate kinase [Neurospora crassa]|eukprot:XP_962801.2 thermoresistant gluconokinase [Neurospora crassa OR74A]
MTVQNTDAALGEQQHLGDQQNSTAAEKKPKNEHRWIWFVTGPTACGKTTVAKALAENLNLTYVEGDDYHPKANVEKMSRGEPLTDADRAGWLQALAEHETAKPPTSSSPHLVITCSALKRHYRDILRLGSEHAGDLRIRFIFLQAPEEVLTERAHNRKGHFAKENLVHSQFTILEMPDPTKPKEEGGEPDVLVVNVGEKEKGVEEVVREVVGRVRGVMHLGRE